MSDEQITNLTIKNFKCHRDFQTTIKPLTILTGSNAAGKSSFLQAVLLGLSILNGPAVSIGKAKKSDLKATGSYHKIRTDNVYGLYFGLPLNLLTEGASTEEIELHIDFGTNKTKAILQMPDDDDALYLVPKSIEAAKKPEFQSFFLGAERLGPRIVSIINNAQPYFVGHSGENTAFLLADMDKKRLNGVRLPEALKIAAVDRFTPNCEAWLNTIIPDTGLRYELVATIKIRNNSGDFRLPTDTGFGITYVLPVIAQALAASTLENSVLIIENPEAHLHPYSQSKLGKFLAKVTENGVQIIMETHSEHIIDGCRLQLAKDRQTDMAKILFFQKNENGSLCQEISLNPYGELAEWPSGFFDQKRNDLRDLLGVRKCGE